MAEPITLFHTTFYASPVGRIAILTMDNGYDHKKPNTFGEASMESLNAALDVVQGDPRVCGLMLTGKPYIFAAGADLSRIPLIKSHQEGYAIGKLGHSSMKRIMDLPFPTLAAINGVALGGGLEIALYCRYRTVSRSARAIGLPECSLGLVPGWGGCTLATKLLGPEKALELIIVNPLSQNRTLDGSEALRTGLADWLFDGAEFLDESLSFLVDIIAGKSVVERQPPPHSDPETLFAKARAFVDSKVHGASPAPYRALELIRGSCAWDVERGFEEENRALGDLIQTPQCQASIYSFDLVNRYARKTHGLVEAEPRRVGKVGILGAGLMASQLASLFILRMEVPVVMKDVSEEAAAGGRAHVLKEIGKRAARGRVSEGRARYLEGLVEGTVRYEDFQGCDLVIEAVFEDQEVKRQVFREAEAFLAEDTILATNTSSLSVSRMSEVLRHPERLVGLHFFNPVAVMPLIEIVKGKRTHQAAIATAFDLCGRLGKTGILVKDSPAFLVNRVLIRMLTDCMAIVDKGAAFRQVDDAVVGLGLPMGPFELLGLVGPPVAFHAMETLNGAFGPERFPLNESFRKMVEEKIPAFYNSLGESREILPEVESVWSRSWEGEFSGEEIRERILENLAREIHLILEEKVVESPKDVDLAMILGAGWPFFLGGITPYLDSTGVSRKVLGRTFLRP